VRVRSGVHEADSQEIALGRTDHRSWGRAVVDPSGEEHARGDFELGVGRRQLVLAHASRPVPLRRRWIEKRVEVRRPADRRSLVSHHRRVTDRTVDVVLRRALVGMGRMVVPARRRVGLERELADERRCREWRRGGEQLSSCETCFSHG